MAGSPDNSNRPQKQAQTRVPLTREDRLELLEHVAYARAGLTANEWELVRKLCEALEGSTDRAQQANVKTLATKCRVSERTVYRAASCGRRAGVIFTVPTYDDRGRSASEWHVAWDRLAVLAGWTRSGDRPAPGWQTLPGAGSHRRILAGTATVWQAPTFCFSSPTEKKLIKPPTSQPVQASNREANGGPNRSDGGRREDFYFRSEANPSADRGGATRGVRAAGNPSEDFFELEQELFAAGVDRAPRAIATAIEQGLDADQVAAIVAHWRAHGGGTNYAAWGPGALCWRLTNARPELPADRGWPAPAPAFERYRQQCRDRELRIRQAHERAARQQETIAAIEETRGRSLLDDFRAAIRERRVSP